MAKTDAQRASEWTGVFEGALDAMLIADDERRYVEANAAACTLLGRTRDQILALRVDDIAPAAARAGVGQSWAEFLHTGQQQGHFDIERPDGTVRAVDFRATAHVAPHRHLSVLRDVTEKRLADEELGRFRRIVEESSDFIGIAGLDGRAQFLNRAGCRLVGIAPEDVAATSIADYLAPGYEECIEQVLREGRFSGEVEFVHRRTGERLPVWWNAFAVHDDAGRRFGLATVTRDLREQKRNAIAQRRSEEVRRRAEERLELALEAAHIGSWDFAPATGELHWDARCRGLLDTSMDAPITYDYFLACVHADDRAAVADAVQRAITIPSASPFRVEFRSARSDGRWLDSRGRAIFDDEGRCVRFTGMILDVTERKRAESINRAARDLAEAANRAKDEFLAMLGHELRNPLAPIATALHLIKLRGEDRFAREHAIVERQVDHLTRLVDDLLDVSRITRGKVKLLRAPVELVEVIKKAVEQALPLIEQKRHRLRIDVPKELVVDGDAARLAQVFANLLTNAAKYSDDDGEIEVSAERCGDAIACRVRDRGHGIARELLPRIFDRFVQGRQELDRSQGGLGLGLAIVRSLVELHGGSVTASSDGRGHGSEMTVRLPAAEPAQRVAVAERSACPAAPLPRRILVVDDNADTAELLGEVLRALGHEVRIAHDGPTALELAAELLPEVALLDIGLPVMDGYEVARRLRQRPELRDLVLIAITGYGQPTDTAAARAAGFDEHVVKPMDMGRVLAVVERARPGHAPT